MRGGVGTLLLALGATASAQDPGYDAHGFTLAPGDGQVLDPLQTWRGGHSVSDGWAVEVLGESVETPLGAFAPQPDGTYVGQPLADDLLGLNVGLAWAASSRLGLTLALPAFVQVVDEAGDSAPALGDLELAAPVALVPASGRLGLSVVPTLGLPTGASTRFVGTGAVVGGGLLAASVRGQMWLLALHGGVESGPEVMGLGNLVGGPRVRGAAAVGVAVRGATGLRLEVVGAAPLLEPPPPVAESPVEAMVSVRHRRPSGLHLTLGAGRALTVGAGASPLRLLLGVGLGAADPPPPAPEPAVLTVRVVDPDGAGLAAAAVTADGAVAETVGADGEVVLERRPGPVALVVSAPGYAAVEVPPLILEVGAHEHEVTLSPLPAQLSVVAVDAGGQPVPATVRFLEGPLSPEPVELGEDGAAMLELRAGDWKLLVAPTGDAFAPEDRVLVLGRGEEAELRLVFEREAVDIEKPILSGVLFAFGEDALRPEAGVVLRDLANTFLAHPEWALVEIEGHTDTKGAADFNQALSERRAQNVRAALVDLGVPAERLQARGLGESELAVATGDEVREQANRRVELEVLAIEVDGRMVPTSEGGSTPPLPRPR